MVESFKNVKLSYFTLNGLGMLPRMLLFHGKVNFENRQITFDKWPEIKPTMQLKFLPQLEVDGAIYSQSQAISVFLSRKIGGLMGKSDEEEYQIIAILNSTSDINPSLFKLVMPSEEDQKPENSKINLDNAIDKISLFLSVYEKRYESNGEGKYYLGEKLSLADFWLISTVGNFILNVLGDKLGEAARKAAPKLIALVERLKTEDPFKSFLESELFLKGSF
jgi:glutathione S-transferase